MAEEKKAKKIYTLDEIKFNEENKSVAIVSWLYVVGLVMMLIEKKDTFVKYVGAQSTLLWILSMFSFVPIIRWFVGPVAFVLMVIGMVKTSKGERFDIPVISDLALKLMSVF